MTEAETLLGPASIGNGTAILCVDDEPQVLSALGRTLRREPYEVLRARGAGEALDLLERFPIKVVLTDERMPQMTGSELLAEVRKKWPLVGRIILTGHPGPAVMIRGLEAGTDFLLTKPWDEDTLRRAIRALIEEVDRSLGSGSGVPPDSWVDFGGEGG
jgi:DNA-binding response OmpR family regulator